MKLTIHPVQYLVSTLFVLYSSRYRLMDPKYGPKPCFGINFTMDKAGPVKVGDPIYATLI